MPRALKKWDALENEARLSRVTEEDLEEALRAQPEIVGDPEDPDFQALVGFAGRELMRRFQEDPSSLPGTFVIKLYLDGMKAIAAGAVSTPDDDQGTVDILAAVSALPPDTARTLLEGELVRLTALVHAYQDTLLELEAA